MDAGRWSRIEEVFHEAAELSPAARPAFLTQACGGDQELRREVEMLLVADRPEDAPVHHAIVQAVAQLPQDSRQGPDMIGTRVGRYTLTGLIGKGGMGVVYRAMREDDFRLQVAIKLLKRGTDTESALSRFRAERQILAGLQHPNIAHVIDGGATEAGLPYFVMEYVDGTPILEYSAKLTVRQRVELFRSVCAAVQYAHEKQVVHRDIKPANILVTPEGIPKLLDFGIAKLLDPAAEGATAALTMTGVRLMTPDYASPEQVRGEPVTPATDVYSLGAVLYELLTGERAHRIQSYSAGEIEREICVRDPGKPSAVVKDLDPDLDNIVLKALRKEPERRYASVHDLSEDLDRFLKDLPVRARKESGTYRARKFLKRNRTLMTTAALSAVIVLALVAALGRFDGSRGKVRSIAVLPLENLSHDPQQDPFTDGITNSLIGNLAKIKSLRIISRDSVMRYKDARKTAANTARELNVTALIEGSVLRSGNRVQVKLQLRTGAMDRMLWTRTYDRDLQGIPALQSDAVRAIAHEIQIPLSPQEGVLVSETRPVRREAYEAYLRGQYQLNKHTREGFQKSMEFFKEAVDIDPVYALAWAGLADCYNELSSITLPAHEAMPKVKAAALRALEIDPTLAEPHTTLAQVQSQYEWDWAASESSHQQALKLNPSYVSEHFYYARFLVEQGRTAEAIREAAEAYRLDPLTPARATNLAWMYFLARRTDEAIAQYRKILQLDPNGAITHYSLGLAYEQKKMFEQASAEFLKASALDADPPTWMWHLAHVYAVSGKSDQARSILAKLLELASQRYVDAYSIGEIHLALGETDEAFKWFEKALQDRSEELLFLKVDPRLDSIRSDPRYKNLLRRIGLPQ